jgi:hypothetical protein
MKLNCERTITKRRRMDNKVVIYDKTLNFDKRIVKNE